MCKKKARILLVLFKNPPKLFYWSKMWECWRNTCSKTLKSNEWSDYNGKIQKVRWNSSIITVAQRMVVKMGEEGSYLYLKRQSEGTWIASKCHISSTKHQSQGEGALARVLVVDHSHGLMMWRTWAMREWEMRLGGAHLSWEGPTTHGKAQTNGLGGEGAWAWERGAT